MNVEQCDIEVKLTGIDQEPEGRLYLEIVLGALRVAVRHQ
jgi:hypothetical protein